jgi:hypothetical protein
MKVIPKAVYLAGPMSGLPEHNFPEFKRAAITLRQRGYEVVSPVEMDEDDGFDSVSAPGVVAGSDVWSRFLARDVKIVADERIDAVVVLPGWEFSRGAQLEVHVARELGKPVLLYPTLEPALPDRHPASDRFHSILRELGDLHNRKQRDYGRDDDPFANVRAANEWGVPEWVGAMVRATDKVRRLQTFASRGTLANEGVIDAFRDLAVYAVIAEVLFEESEANASA